MSARRFAQRGAALLTAMLTVTLVATMATAALWQQWRSVEVEVAERSRAQLSWVLTGALDWARLIQRGDARAGLADHLSEPWASPLPETSLSSFLVQDPGHTEALQEAYLSGQITDLQARLNVFNLVDQGVVSDSALQAFGKLFKLLGLPPAQLGALADNLRLASAPGQASSAPLPPRELEQLQALGLSASSLQALRPHISLLPQRSPVNLNTASAAVIYAVLPELTLLQAQALVIDKAL